MKGVVFTEFMEMVETNFGEETLEKIIDRAGVSGAYTSIGTYPHFEIVQLVVALSETTKLEVSELLMAFGEYIFASFTRLYPNFFKGINHAFDFLENVENYIHVEVQKIYPKAELPRFTTNRLDNHRLEMVYHSDRKMADLAVGLIDGCLNHFENRGNVNVVKIEKEGEVVHFLIELEK